MVTGFHTLCSFITTSTVQPLTHKIPDSYISLNVAFGNGIGEIPISSIARKAERLKPQCKITYKLIKEYIMSKYNFKVHTAYIAEVKHDLGLTMYNAPNAVAELKNPRKHPTDIQIIAITDALTHFSII